MKRTYLIILRVASTISVRDLFARPLSLIIKLFVEL